MSKIYDFDIDTYKESSIQNFYSLIRGLSDEERYKYEKFHNEMYGDSTSDTGTKVVIPEKCREMNRCANILKKLFPESIINVFYDFNEYLKSEGYKPIEYDCGMLNVINGWELTISGDENLQLFKHIMESCGGRLSVKNFRVDEAESNLYTNYVSMDFEFLHTTAG